MPHLADVPDLSGLAALARDPRLDLKPVVLRVQTDLFLAAPIRDAGPLLGHVHIADNNRLEYGAGCLDVRPSFRALAEIGYTGWISLECFSADGPRVTEPASESLTRSVALLRSGWADVTAAG